MKLIRALNVYKTYHTSGDVKVLKGVSIDVDAGEMVCIVGPSGAGKSTLLHILGTLDRPDSGELYFKDQDILKLTDKKLSTFRNLNMGFVFQFHHLLPEFTALENIAMPGWISGLNEDECYQRAKELAERMGILHRLQHKPSELSGGEQQRVSVARALLNKPSVVFADEPSGNLDEHNARELHQLFKSLKEETGVSFIIVTHNKELASSADRQLVMKDGIFTI